MLETKKIVAIIVVIVVVVAGIGIAWFVLNDSKERVSISAALEVYGNANNDSRIDQADIDMINEIIAGDRSFEDYPLADADQSGEIDNLDIEKVKEILNANATNKVKVWHANHHDGGIDIVETTYPITSAIATGAANTILVFKYLGIVDELKGFSWVNTPDSALFPEYMHLITEDQRLETSATRINVDKASNLVTSENVSAAITSDNRLYLQNEEKTLEQMGVDVVRIQAAAIDSEEYMSAVLLIAFLFDTGGKEYVDKCIELIGWYEDFLTDLNNSLNNVRNKVSAVASSSTTGVSTGSSDYTDVLRTAGATFPLTDIPSDSTNANYNGPGGDTWLNRYVIDYLICLRTSTSEFSWYDGTALTNGAGTLKTYIYNWKTLECYEQNNVYVICGDMPVMLRIAYVAQTLYGDVLGSDYAYNIHMDFVKKFFDWDENMIKGKAFVVSMGDLGITN